MGTWTKETGRKWRTDPTGPRGEGGNQPDGGAATNRLPSVLSTLYLEKPQWGGHRSVKKTDRGKEQPATAKTDRPAGCPHREGVLPKENSRPVRARRETERGCLPKTGMPRQPEKGTTSKEATRIRTVVSTRPAKSRSGALIPPTERHRSFREKKRKARRITGEGLLGVRPCKKKIQE